MDTRLKPQGMHPSSIPSNWYRNLAVNGNMDIAQLRTSFATTTNASSGYVLDHWKFYLDSNSGTLPTVTYSQIQLTPGELPGSRYAHRTNVNGAGSSFGATAQDVVYTGIENGIRYLWQTGGKATVVVYIRSTIAGKKCGIRVIQNYGTGGTPSASDQLTAVAVTVTTANVWQKVVIPVTLTSPSGKTFGSNNDDYIGVDFRWVYGLSLAGLAGDTVAEGYRGAGSFDIAQLAIYPFEYELPYQPKSWDEEYTACLRYKCKTFPYATAAATGAGFAGSITSQAVTSSTFLYQNWYFPRRMRTTPTITTYNPTSANNQWRDQNASADKSSVVNQTSDTAVTIAMNTTTTAGNILSIHAFADADFL